MDIFRFLIGNSWKEYDIICFKYHITLPNLRHSYGLLYKYIFMWYGEYGTNKKTRIIEHCCEVSRHRFEIASKYKYSIFSSFF